MNLLIILFGMLFYLHYQINQCYSKTAFLDMERPLIEWFDSRYCKNFTMVCRRFSRKDPRHYLDMHVHSLIKINESLLIDVYFYQLLSNRYQPSFVEMHLKFCDMLEHDSFLGLTLKNALPGRVCPLVPGEYHLLNMTIPFVPIGFPFTKGRIYLNVSLHLNGVTEVIGGGKVDMEVKEFQIRKN